MNEYEHSQTVQAQADRVFDFASNLNNLPEYLPTVRQAIVQPGGRIRVQGEANGQPYDSDGTFRIDKARRRMEWSADGNRQYSGWLEVNEDGRHASEVTVHLSFAVGPNDRRKLAQSTGSADAAIMEGLQKSLQSLVNLIEGTGGKVEVRAAY